MSVRSRPLESDGYDLHPELGNTGDVREGPPRSARDRESEDITITLPEGLRVEAVPAAAHSERSFAVYSLAASVEDGSRIRIARGLTIGKSLIPLAQYPVLKSFFDQTRAGDEGQIVLSVDKK